MPIHQNSLAAVRRGLLTALLLGGLACAHAQTAQTATSADDPQNTVRPQQLFIERPATTLSATRILELLTTRPEITVEVKHWLAEKLRTAGFNVQEDTITDEGLFTRINEDERLRASVAILLRSRGYLDNDSANENDTTNRTTAAESELPRGRAGMGTGSASWPPISQTSTQTGLPVLDPAQNSVIDTLTGGVRAMGSDALSGGLSGQRNDSSILYGTAAAGSEVDAFAALDQLNSTGLPGSSPLDPTSAAGAAALALRAGNSPGGLPSGLDPLSRSANSSTTPNRELPDDLRRNPALLPLKKPAPEPQPEVLRKPAPYNLLALRDLYQQIAISSQPLKRFGAEVFATRGFASPVSAQDQPIGPDYVLGSGDTLTVNLWGGVSQTLNRIVDATGRIALPEIGAVQVAGLRLEQAQAMLQRNFAPQFRDAHVEITVARLRTVRVYVTGDVERPGAYTLQALSTPLNALYVAGGPTAIGSLRTVKQMRGTRVVAEIDLYDFLLHGVHAPVERLQDGDTILVPPAGPQIAVNGSVKRPGIYELKRDSGDKQSLAETLELAGGAQAAAALAHISVDRIGEDGHRATLNVGTPSDASATLHQEISAFTMQDGDRVHVGTIEPWSDSAVYLEGHVLRPGRKPFHQGMTLRDVVVSYKDLLPEPSDHAEIIRLVPPEMRPETVEFQLGDALAGRVPLTLQPFDTVRISGRYEVDAPRVTVRGEVLRPGLYALSEGETAGELVKMAGGFTRSALRSEADLASYDVRDGKSVESERTTIVIGEAVDRSGSAADPKLKPGDVLTVHQVSGWNDIGASVKLNGEVNYPGTYGLQSGERLSSVLLRAGGFRDTAYPDGAILLRVQVREFEEKTKLDLIHQIESSSVTARLGTNVSGQDQTGVVQLLIQQQQQVLQRLRSQPATGRMVIHISSDLRSWQGTTNDIELRAGDVIVIPKRPGFVLVSGQVYNASALTYTPDKNAEWYLKRAGGATDLAESKDIFIVRANGEVVGRHSKGGHGDVLKTKLNAGDVVVVPQKIIGGSVFWRNLLTTAQLFSSIAIPLAIAGI